MSLCRSCQRFDIQSFASAPYQTRGYRLATVKQSAANENCQFCQFLCRALEDIGQRWQQRHVAEELWVHLRMSKDNDWKLQKRDLSFSGLAFNRLDIYVCPRHIMTTLRGANDLERLEGNVSCRVLADQVSPAALNGDVSGVYLGDDPGSDAHFDAISKWLVNCLEHPKCNENASGTATFDATDALLPTRCIEIGQENIRLRHTAGELGSYITLTHRWQPDTQQSSTTAENITHRMELIQIEELPRSFQDAVTVTRRLGIRYLWIDSICIIQRGDDGRDWKLEALQMSQYYQGSILTIAPSAALTNGFLAPRSSGPIGQLIRLPYRDRSGAHQGCFYLQQRQGDVHSEYLVSVERGELISRGWVFQEWLLSRRIIHYTASQIFFECQTSDPRNESNESVEAHRSVAEYFNLHVLGIEEVGLKRIFSKNRTTTQELWRRLVEAYSGRPLTKPGQDRILALSGLAKEVRLMRMEAAHNQHEEPYVAGWWLGDVHNGLLWEHRVWTPQYSNIYAPTWSWAAWSTNVHFRHIANELLPAIELKRTISNTEYFGVDAESQVGPSKNELDIDNLFTCVVLRGKVSIVLVGPSLRRAECYTLAEYTGVAPKYMGRWRAISCPDKPDTHIGWADVEHFGPPQTGTSPESTQVCLALHISTHPKVAGGLEFGYWGFTHEVYCTLLISPYDRSGQDRPNRYIRAGVGRIYKKHFFADADEMDIELA